MTANGKSDLIGTNSVRGSLDRTVLGEVGEVTKDDVRVNAAATCEAANAALGHAVALGGYAIDVARTLTSLQNDLFDLSADLAAPLDGSYAEEPVRITEQHIAWVDRAYAHYSQDLEKVTEGAVLPGGTVAASLLFQARIQVRAAERATWQAYHEHPGQISELTARYLNSVSSLLFTLARYHNIDLGDTMWHPHASIAGPAD